MLDQPLLGMVVALLPLPVAYLLGCRVLQRVEEPTFAEEWFRYRRAMSKLAVAVFATAIVLAPQWTAAWFAEATLAGWIGNFSAQKRLYNEEWSLSGFLAWQTRQTFGAMGLRILWLAAPLLVAAFGAAWALPLFVIMLAWQLGHESILLRACDAQPITDSALNARFAAILAKATCPEPRVRSIGPRRGFFMNAFALPGTRRGSVLLTDTLLRTLEPDETGAIFAHEVAHLEELTPRRTSRQQGWAIAWLAFGMLVAWAAARNSQETALAFGIVWPVIMILAGRVRRWRHIAHEAASDARAVELCGDVDAVIRALTKLHTLSRVPRRLDSALEARMTHPSLARRIQALRAKYGATQDPEAPPAEGAVETLILKSRKRSGDYVLLNRTVLRWLSGIPTETPETAEALTNAATSIQQIPFADLTALHTRPSLSGPFLVFREGLNASRAFPMHRHDAAAAQAALDHLDIHLGALPMSRSTPIENPFPRVVTAFAFILATTAGAIPAMLAAVVAFVSPVPATLAAAGATAVAVALAAALGYPSAGAPERHEMLYLTLGVLGIFGLLALGLAIRARGDHRPKQGTWVVIAVLLAGALVGAFPILVSRRALVISMVARTHPSLIVSLAGLAAALAFFPRVSIRASSIVPLLLLAATIYATTPSFTRDYVVDPLMAARPARKVGPPALLASAAYDHTIDRIHLSPDGMHYVARVRSDDDPRGIRPAPLVLGTRYGSPAPLGEALDAGFLSNNLLAIYEVHGHQAQVRVTTLDGHDQSTTPVPELADDASFFVGGGRWTIFGMRPRSYARVEGGSLVTAEWSLRPMVKAVADAGPRLVLAARDATPVLASMAGMTSEVVRVSESGRKDDDLAHTLLDVRFQRIPGDTTNIFCFAPDQSRTHVSLLDAATRRLTPLAWLPGVIAEAAVAPDRRMVMRSSFGDVVLFNPGNDAVSMVDTSEIDDPADIAIGEHAIVVVQWTTHGSQILFYSTRVVE